MKKNHKLPLSMVLSGGVLLLILLAALLAPLSPHDPIAVETVQKFLPPSAQHLLGTDNFGRDTFTPPALRRTGLPAGGLSVHAHLHCVWHGVRHR